MRDFRAKGLLGPDSSRIDAIGPDLAPHRHWTKSLASLEEFGLADLFGDGEGARGDKAPASANSGSGSASSSSGSARASASVPAASFGGRPYGSPLNIVVADNAHRPRSKYVQASAYVSERSLVRKSFIEVMPGLAISSPELLFLEMADSMSLPEHLMLGHELCGSFSRDARDPLNGDVALQVPPLTTKARLEAYCNAARWSRGGALACRTLALLADNAWSPTESLVAALASLPLVECGYELGPCILNKRVENQGLVAKASRFAARYPDIMFQNTPVGINYDGTVHLDLNAIVRAALNLREEPGSAAFDRELDLVVRQVRAKAVDDIRRNRELAAAGCIVFQVVKEDLYEENGLDHVMMQVIEAIERYSGHDMSEHKRALENKFLRAKRQELIWSLLSGKHQSFASGREEAFSYLYQPGKTLTATVGF